MIKRTTLILLAACFLSVFSLSAQKDAVINFLSVNGSTAYSGQMRVKSHYDFKPYTGGCENIGIGYQLYANHFTFSIGAEGGSTIMTNYSDQETKRNPKGTLELIGNLHVNTPVLLGGEFNKFYFKVGVVPSFNLLNGATIIGPVMNPDNPTTYENTKKVRFRNPVQLFGRFEIGGSFGKFTPFDDPIQPLARFYLGGYVDFGFTNDMEKKWKDGSEGRGHYGKIPYACSYEGFNDEVYQFSVGLRFTCLLNFAR